MGSIDGPVFLDPVVILFSEVIILPVSVGLIEKYHSRIKIHHVLKAVSQFGAGCVVAWLEPIWVFLNESKSGEWNWHWLVTPALWSGVVYWQRWCCLLYTSPSPRDDCPSRMPSSA